MPRNPYAFRPPPIGGTPMKFKWHRAFTPPGAIPFPTNLGNAARSLGDRALDQRGQSLIVV